MVIDAMNWMKEQYYMQKRGDMWSTRINMRYNYRWNANKMKRTVILDERLKHRVDIR